MREHLYATQLNGDLNVHQEKQGKQSSFMFAAAQRNLDIQEQTKIAKKILYSRSGLSSP